MKLADRKEIVVLLKNMFPNVYFQERCHLVPFSKWRVVESSNLHNEGYILNITYGLENVDVLENIVRAAHALEVVYI